MSVVRALRIIDCPKSGIILRNVFQHFNNSLLFRRHVSSSAVLWKEKTEKEESKLRGYIMSSYLKYVTNYEQVLEKRFPSAMHVYRIFTYGIKSFYQDLKTFFKIRLLVLRLSEEEGLGTLKRQEIELYDQMPKDMWKISPVLLLSALPFANYVVFPVAYMYPRRLLTSHFWTEAQKETFDCLYLKDRLRYNKPLLRSLISRTKAITDQNMKAKWEIILKILGKGEHPSPEIIIECKDLFCVGPYSISNLHYNHKRNLLHSHGLSLGFSPHNNLEKRAFILKEMDKAIIRDGGIKSMSTKEMKSACLIRGLHGSRMTEKELIEWLDKWIFLSNAVDSDSYSLLLHTQMLISLNNPHNTLLQC